MKCDATYKGVCLMQWNDLRRYMFGAQVTRVDSSAAVEGQFGAQPSAGRSWVQKYSITLEPRVSSSSSAYMLV